MLLTIDIGNTSIHVGVLENRRIIRTTIIQTDTKKPDIFKSLKKCLGDDKIKIKGVIVSSVVPKVTIITKHVVKRLLNISQLYWVKILRCL